MEAALGKARRLAINRSGTCAIRELGIALREMDATRGAALPARDFLSALQAHGIALSPEEEAALLSGVSRRDGSINVAQFLEGLCGVLTPPRQALLDQVFLRFDRGASGLADLEAVQRAYNAAKHPQVLNQTRKEKEVAEEFAALFNTRTNPNGKVSFNELYEFYAGFAATVDDDAYFRAVLTATWGLDTKVITPPNLSATQTVPSRTLGGTFARTDTGSTYLRQYADVPRPQIFMDISIANDTPQRVVIELFADIAPKTCENFRALCTGEQGIGAQGKPLCYKGLKFHRIIPGFCIQGGDVQFNNGKGGESIYGKQFADETFEIAFRQAGLLAMANQGPNTNNSQFFFTMKEARYLDDRHVAFGRVVKNFEFLKQIERFGSDNGLPLKEVVITDCGQLNA